MTDVWTNNFLDHAIYSLYNGNSSLPVFRRLESLPSSSSVQVTAFFLRPGKGSKIRKHWNWYHHWVGSLVVFLAAINIALGIQVGEAGNSWKIGCGIILAIISIAVALLESMRWWSRLSEKTTEPPAF